MKIGILILALGLAPMAAQAQLVQERTLEPFDRLRVTNRITIFAEQGEQQRARLELINIAPEDVITEVSQGQLHIRLRAGLRPDARVEVYLTYRELRMISASASGTVSVQDTLTAAQLTLSTNTNGHIGLAARVKELEITARKAGMISISGVAENVAAQVHTGATLAGSGLVADHVALRISTKGTAKIVATQTLTGSVRSGGYLAYGGAPTKRLDTGMGTTVVSL